MLVLQFEQLQAAAQWGSHYDCCSGNFSFLLLQVEPQAAANGPQEGLVRVVGQATSMPFHCCFSLQQHDYTGMGMLAQKTTL